MVSKFKGMGCLKQLYYCLLFGVCLWTNIATAQTDNILDSLQRSYALTTIDTVKVESLIELGDYYLYKNLDSTVGYYNKAQTTIEGLNSEIRAKYEPLLLHYTSIAYTSWGYVKEGMEYGQKALKSYEAAGMQEEASDIYMVIGTLYGQMGEVQKGTKLLLKSIAIKKELNATKKLGHAYMNLTLLYRDLGMLDSAVASIDSALTRFKAQGFEMGVNRSYQIKGEVHKFAGENKKALEVYQTALESYRNQTTKDIKGEIVLLNSIAGLYKILKEYDRAIVYYQNGLDLLQTTDNKELEGLINHNIGGVYLEENRYEEALDYYQKGLNFYEQISHPTGRSRSYRGIGNVYQSTEKYDSAIVYYTKATNVLASKKNLDYGDICKNLAKLHYELYSKTRTENSTEAAQSLKEAQYYAEESIECPAANLDASLGRYRILKAIYQATNNYKDGLEVANQIIELSDSLFKKNKIDAVLDLETKYQTEKKEFEIKSLNQEKALQLAENKQQKTLLYAGGGILVIALLLLGMLYWFFAQKRRANAALTAKNDLITQQKKVVDQQNEEKELLLKEIHHRVKNNLQIISSLLDLQSNKIEDTTARTAIADGQARVKSMALIHHKLYQHEDIATINFKEYTEQLYHQIMATLTDMEPNLILDIDAKVAFDIDTAIPLGLILNELLTNACKYAFANNTRPELKIVLKKLEEGSYLLQVQDNGKGMPVDFQLQKARSLGLRLVRRLSKQLFGKATYENSNGALFSIYFKDTALRKTID